MQRIMRMSVLAGVVVMAFALTASAQPPAGGMRHPGGQGAGQMGQGRGMGHAEDMLAQLNLTDAQKQQIHQLMSDSQAKNKGLMEQMMKLHEQLRDQVFADNGPAEGVDQTARQLSDLQGNMMQSQISLHEQISKLLDPAQRKKMREMPMGAMMGMMMGMMAPGGRGK